MLLLHTFHMTTNNIDTPMKRYFDFMTSQQPVNTPVSGFSFGGKQPVNTPVSGFSFGGKQPVNTPVNGFSFGCKQPVNIPVNDFSFGGKQPKNTPKGDVFGSSGFDKQKNKTKITSPIEEKLGKWKQFMNETTFNKFMTFITDTQKSTILLDQILIIKTGNNVNNKSDIMKDIVSLIGSSHVEHHDNGHLINISDYHTTKATIFDNIYKFNCNIDKISNNIILFVNDLDHIPYGLVKQGIIIDLTKTHTYKRHHKTNNYVSKKSKHN
jgi:hypothetical protein